MPRFEILLEVITDADLIAYNKSYDPATGIYHASLTPIREYLDTFGEDTIDITYQISDVSNIAVKNSSRSKTINLPDTPNNRRVFSSISEMGFVDGYNAKRKSRCYVLVDTVIVFEGYLQLVNYTVDIFRNGPVYQVILSTSTKNLKDQLGDSLIENLPWGGIEQYWNYQNVQDTWKTSVGGEVFYPLIDYGWNLATESLGGTVGGLEYALNLDYWNLSTGAPSGIMVYTENFYPAIYLKSYVDRIFKSAGYRYKSDFFNSERFRSIVIPYNGTETMLKYDINEEGTGTYGYGKSYRVRRNTDQNLGVVGGATQYVSDAFNWNDSSSSGYFDPGGFITLANGLYTQVRSNNIYSQSFTANIGIYCIDTLSGAEVDMITDASIAQVAVYLFRSSGSPTGAVVAPGYGPTVMENGYAQQRWDFRGGVPGVGSQTVEFNQGSIPITGPGSGGGVVIRAITATLKTPFLNNPSYHDYRIVENGAVISKYPWVNYGAMRPNEKIGYSLVVTWSGAAQTNFAFYLAVDSNHNNDVSLNVINEQKIDIGNIVPKNIKCIDLISSLINTFNLYVEPDKEDDSVLIIEPREQFFNGDLLDWSDKVDLSKQIDVKILGETQNKFTKFRWKDGKDYGSKTYASKYGQSIGEFTYNSGNDFATGTTEITPMFTTGANFKLPRKGLSGVDTAQPGIIIPNYTEKLNTVDAPIYDGYPYGKTFPATDLRILFTKKQMNCVFATSLPEQVPQAFYFGVPDYYAPLAAVGFPGGYSGVFPWYPYAGSIDDLYAPTLDLNFNTPRGLYYKLDDYGRKWTSHNLLTDYWATYMGELNNRDSRILTVYLKLDPGDLAKFSFRNIIYLRINHPSVGLNQGSYFKVNAITGYNPSINAPCKVELLMTESGNVHNLYNYKDPSTIPIGGSI